MRIPFSLYVILVAFPFLMSCSQASNEHPPGSVLIKSLKKNVPFYAIAFTPVFADRFSLSKDRALSLSDGLHAVAIEINQTNNKFECGVHLYIDNAVDIYSPHGGNNYSRKTLAEHFFVNDFTEVDKIHNELRLDKSYNKIIYRHRSVSADKKGLVSTLKYQRYEREIYSGMSLLSTGIICSMLDSSYGDAEILVQKNTKNDYLLGHEDPGNLKHPEYNNSFLIPHKLLQLIQPYIDYVGNKQYESFNKGKDNWAVYDDDPTVEIP